MDINLTKDLKYNIVSIPKEKVNKIEPLLNFLFVVYNEIEMWEMQKNLAPLDGYGVILDLIEEECLQHFYIGKFFKYNIVLSKTSDMGAVNVNSVINVINRAIQIFKPRYIIMPGISAGLDDKLKIGDVIIANKIIGYESEKIAPTEIIGRYPQYHSMRLFNLFCSANILSFNNYLKEEIQKELDNELNRDKPNCMTIGVRTQQKEFLWSQMLSNGCFPYVYTGNYISGEKLLDNSFYRTYLKTKFQEVAALDMEGIGVASASIFNRVYDWLVIKGISDLGDGNKAKNKNLNQIYAMKNVIFALKKVFNNEYSFSASNLKQTRSLNRKNVLISASQCESGEYAKLTEKFMEELAKQIILNNYNVLSGYGVGVGSAVLFGVFDGCEQLGLTSHEYFDRLQTFPFPRIDPNSVNKNKLMRCKIKNREVLCLNANVAVFVFGNKNGNENLYADGMREELNLVAKNNALILPVGCTGGTAKLLYDEIKTENFKTNYLRPYFYERNKYRAVSSNCEEDVSDYFKKLDQLNKLSLKEENIYEVVQKIL